MINIKVPKNNINERKYIIDILLGEFLGLDYEVIVDSDSDSWEIILENGNKLKIEDHFFSKFRKDLEYLKEENFPKKVEFSKNDFIVENDIPIIYGKNKVTVTRDSDRKIIDCGIDIFASSFFMLTRWEEYVNKARDKHNRFPATASLAFKSNFLDRPVVNEYVEMFWNMLKFLGCKQERTKREFEFILTHDVDHIYKFNTFGSGLKEIAHDIIKKKNIKRAYQNVSQKIKSHLQIEKNPYDTFDYLMDVSEKNSTKSYFFFMAEGTSSFDNMYSTKDNFIIELVNKIKKRGHYIGIHPTYNAYNDSKQFQKEKNELEKNLNTNITVGREHVLRFEVPTTWQVWDDNGMEWDSTLSFADKEGFRCGVCYEYSVFNVLIRKKLKLKERPLIVMEGSFLSYQPNIVPKEMEEKIVKLINKVKQYDGSFVFLWHNSSFNTPMWKEYQYIYEKVIKK